MKVTMIVTVLVVCFLFTACAPGTQHFESPNHQAGFFMGIWHGWIAPVSLIWGLFDSGIRVYEVNNRGWLYDFGFYIAIIGGFGGLALSRNKKKRKKD
ncbi:MAG: hypothetical protein CVU48_05835 [Candidatus Cloacimonetes bacterium HGW-Cloacimonetes-1]|jgi:hypothetical protein|nr:MAG: hypothetical protein CVU48_05835 [Candidatus Cloacimonetes bacterium HGW-Cloacimonetes-1]